MLERNVVECVDSLGSFRGSILFFLPSLFIPRQIKWSNFFRHSSYVSKAFDMCTRALIIMRLFMFMCSYLHSSKLHTQEFDELMQALMISELMAWILG